MAVYFIWSPEAELMKIGNSDRPLNRLEEAEEVKELTQKERVKRMLERGWTCSGVLNDICWRYSARIHDLRNDGFHIEDRACTCANSKAGFRHWRIVSEARDWIEERAAILEFEANMPRAQADREAVRMWAEYAK